MDMENNYVILTKDEYTELLKAQTTLDTVKAVLGKEKYNPKETLMVILGMEVGDE